MKKVMEGESEQEGEEHESAKGRADSALLSNGGTPGAGEMTDASKGTASCERGVRGGRRTQNHRFHSV
ncbi:hypothetical protein EVAR_97594_1 [Eumeta japonica]|uniref:Uncharacterized protein n=1 Tax=Eumeta variegata TaxID=151549 RepID=A0A4C1XMR1_EUMVA|nr:hypothetical protein EVAR_97594_1 [Eumeta japonica]